MSLSREELRLASLLDTPDMGLVRFALVLLSLHQASAKKTEDPSECEGAHATSAVLPMRQ